MPITHFLKHTMILCISFSLFLALPLAAKAPLGKSTDNFKSASVDNNSYINANLILMFVTNHGNFGRDLGGVFGYDYGTWYPYTGNIEDYANHTIFGDYSPLYAAGLWIGGTVNGDTCVTVSEYSSEFVPGPMANNTFMPDQPEFKVYKLYFDSLQTNPNSDYLNWPVSQGAPVDEQGRPLMRGDQMLWSVFNDANSAKHTNMATSPLGLEVQMTTIAESSYSSAVFLVYKIYNKGLNTIDDCYFSFWSDPDIGDFSDDLIACDSISNIWICYNSTNNDASYGTAPPALGFKLLYGPKVPSNGDSAYFDGKYIANYKNLPMTSFSHFYNGTDPDGPREAYRYMTGKTPDGNPFIYNGKEVSYQVSGNPVNHLGDLDVNPSDRRMMASTGPFTFAPGDSQFVMIKMGVEKLASNLISITTLRNSLNAPYNLPTDIDDIEPNSLPQSFSLEQNYPNPFNPTTKINFSLPIRSNVTLEIFNVLGQKVSTLVHEKLSAGNHVVEWDGTDYTTGLYFYKLTIGDNSYSKKMLLLK